MCYVYHYTTVEGFKGIVESQEIWATSIYCLNDFKEFTHGRDALISSAKALLKSEKAADATARLLWYMYDMCPPLFVCSFSTAGDGDDLPQWREYSRGGGYAIGLPIATLHSHAGMQRFDLWQCIYGTGDVHGFAEGVVKIIQNIFELSGGVDGFRSQFPFRDPSKDGLLAMLLKFVARYKHDAFIAEKEWRLVHLLEPGDPQRFRMSDGVQVPYVAFPLKNERLWEQAQIIVSPGLPAEAKDRQKFATEFLKSKLRKHGLPSDCAGHVRLSQAPYRAAIGR